MAYYRVDMYADDEDHAVISLGEREGKTVRKFLEKVEEETKGAPRWAGGIWSIEGPFETENEAWDALRRERK